jgi:oligopeptide transport system substrate-binding protein
MLDSMADPRRALAREMPKVSDDGRTRTFNLRDDARWSDGRPITSAEFRFAWDNASKSVTTFESRSAV